MGESTLASTNDNMRWLSLAWMYLVSKNDGIFYQEPINELQYKINESKIANLQGEQAALLKQLFAMNTEVFKELTQALLGKKVLTLTELEPFLNRVQIPEGFPRPVLKDDPA